VTRELDRGDGLLTEPAGMQLLVGLCVHVVECGKTRI
jgi:hypothetical protein